MTENRRIFWNVVATYGRSLFSLLCGLFTARWVFNLLGQTDYGLLGVVGSLTAFIGFVNNELAFANSRFYAVSIGRSRISKDPEVGLEDCQRWFNTALSIHIIVPIVLVLIGYPLGVWAVRNFLTIPPDRVEACVWVFRFACFSCFIGMISVPYNAMYGAKQYIAELTIYSYVTTLLNIAVVYYMLCHPRDWLALYAGWGSLLGLLPAIVITLRARFIFPECRIKLRYMWDLRRIKQVGSFAGWHTLGAVCVLLRVQGIGILINKVFGPMVNAAMAIGNTVNAHATSMGGSLRGAFSPAIMNAYGENNQAKMINLVFRSCKFGTLLNLIFILPIALELPYILTSWLKTPPRYATVLCLSALICEVIDGVARGHCVAVDASGRISEYHKNMTVISILTLPIAILVVWLGGGVYGLALLLPVVRLLIVMRRVYYSSLFAHVPIGTWLSNTVLPIMCVVVVGLAAAGLPHLVLEESFMRVCITTILAEVVLVLLSWRFVFDEDERDYVFGKLLSLVGLVGRMRGAVGS